MPNPDVVKEAKRGVEAERELRRQYQELIENPALCDILNHVSQWESDARKSGDSEMENATKKCLHHEAAKTLTRVRTYIQTKLEPID